MSVFCDFPLLKWFVAALLVATAQVAIAPNTAQAECGDYVILGGHGIHRAAFHQDGNHLNGIHANGPPRDVAANHPLHRSGCSGPNCSNDSPRPLEGPTLPIETDVRQWGVMAVRWLRAAHVTRFAQFADDASLPQIAANSVYRPPR